VSAIVEGVSPVVCILPTGGGKTTVILVPALVNEGKTTVVITPYVALADDLVERCKTSGIRCMRWTKPTVERATVVVVVSDTATSQEFTSYVRDLFLRECLGSVYFDEAHTLRTEMHFRQKFELFKRMTLAVPWIFLTATLPPSMVPGFEESLAVTRPRPTYFRAATNRVSMSYSVIGVKDGGVEEALAGILDEAVKKLSEGEKILVFCPSVSGVERLAGRIKCCCYHSKLEKKYEWLARWKRGEEKVMVTTSALGAGLDVSGVMHVFHVERPYGCIQFVQESGRAGRGGERVKSTMILEEGEIQRLARMDGQFFSMDNRALRKFIITGGCRRRPLSRYVDGEDKEVDCKGLGGERCDNCGEMEMEIISQKRRGEVEDEEETRKRRIVRLYEKREEEVQENEQEEGMLMDHIVRMVDGLKGKCTICWTKGRYDEYSGHSAQECETGMVLGIGGRRVRFAENSCCFKCCLPGDMCKFYGHQLACDSAELVKHWVEIKVDESDLSMLEAIEEVAGRRFEMDEKGVKELWKWMVKERRVMGHNGTNLFAVFCASLRKCNF
jgi:superfamily II DNA helicase RecQ